MKRMKMTYLLATILAFSSCKKAANKEATEQEWMVSAFVGAGGPSYNDGIGEAAAFNRAYSMTTDANGNIFVADRLNLRIRKVSKDGVVTTFAGDGNEGFVNGPGATARFGYNNQITCDAQNNLYLTDPSNSCIRKITPDGVFSTFTTDVQIENFADIAVDPSNNIYYIDKRGIGKVTPNGTASIIVQNGSSNIIGPIATASIPNPTSLCADNKGNVYVASYRSANVVIFKIADGIVSVAAGAFDADEGYQLGLGSIARLRTVKNMTADKSGNVYIVDNNHVVTKITPDGFVRLVAGANYAGIGVQPFVPGPAFEAVFGDICDVAVDPNGIIYALEDIGSNSIRKIFLVDISSPPSQSEIEKANWNKPTGWK